MTGSPVWLNFIERKLPWIRGIAIPRIGFLLVTLQALGFLFISMNPLWLERLALIPHEVLENKEYWRLVTLLSLPISDSPIWAFFALWFLFTIVEAIEGVWGDFRTTFFLLISWSVTIAYSLTTGYTVTRATDFESMLFLAGATLFPEAEASLFFIMPIKWKWLGGFTALLQIIQFIRGDWGDRGYLLAIFSSYLLFFGPAALDRIKNYYRRRNWNRR
ncbi:MAG: hypothetical protein JNL01_10135 [Bdellovibrionales bacterium]|nr:hypothetical protein [Bdellovibrionales bacterium]